MRYTYCPQCAARLGEKEEHPHCENCHWTYYNNSAPTASVFIVKDDNVLLTIRGIEPFKGTVGVVGGFLESGEHPELGAIREAKEETGLDVRLKALLGVYMDTYGDISRPTLNFFFVAEVSGGELQAQDDVASVSWVPIEEAEAEKTGFACLHEALIDLKTWYRASNS